MADKDAVYTPESLKKQAAEFQAAHANAPTFTPAADMENTSTAADLQNPVPWQVIKHGTVHLERSGERHSVDFFCLLDNELIMGTFDRRWIFNPLLDTVTIKAPLKTETLTRLQNYVQTLISHA